MAFFTRVNTNVPFLPKSECHSENNSKQTEDEGNQCTNNDNKCDVRENAEGGNDDQVNKQESSGRYEYVVDRVLGVEV